MYLLGIKIRNYILTSIFLNDALINGISSNTILKNRSFKVLKEVTSLAPYK